MTWEQKLEALRLAGERGADAHYVLLTKSEKVTEQTCNDNYGLMIDTPADAGGYVSTQWSVLHREYFLDSCVSGHPRRPVTRPTAPAPAPPEAPDN